MSLRAGDGDSKGGHNKPQLFASKTTKSLEIILSQERGCKTNVASEYSTNLPDEGKKAV